MIWPKRLVAYWQIWILQTVSSCCRLEKEIKAVILAAVIPPEIEDIVYAISEELEQKHGRAMFWAVRSSAIGEDLENSFAGQFSSILNVPTVQLPG